MIRAKTRRRHYMGYSLRLPTWDLYMYHPTNGRRIDPSWVGPIELFLVPASAPRLV